MKNFRVHILYLILGCLSLHISFSQTYLSPVVGYDFQKVLPAPLNFFNLGLDFKNKGFGNTSPLIGVNLRQKLINKFYLEGTSDFNHKHVQSFFYGSFFQDLIFHYNYLRNNFFLTYYWKGKWKVGGGIMYNIVNNLYYEDKENNYRSNQRYNYSEKGVMLKLGWKYNKFEFEAYYSKRLGTPLLVGGTIYGYSLHQIQSLGFRVSYDFKIFDECKKKKKEKPELPPVNKMAFVEYVN